MKFKDVNKRNGVGETNLMTAVCDSNVKRVEQLLKMDADPNIPENNGITPLMEAAAWGNKKIIKLLLSCGADLTLTDNFGDDAVIYARSEGEEKIALFLEDIRRRAKTGKTPRKRKLS